MSACRESRADEVIRLWPAARAARLADRLSDLMEIQKTEPWRLQISDHGDAMMLDRWRVASVVLAIKGLWAPPTRTPDLVREACAIGRQRGFRQLLSPLLSASEMEPYLDAGLRVREHLVVMQSSVEERSVPRHPRADLAVRDAKSADLDSISALDEAGFDDLWRYGVDEIRGFMREHSVFVAQRGDRVVGYCAVLDHGLSSTIGRLAVDVNARRSGVGTALVTEAFAHAKRAGSLGVTLCTQRNNTAARALYREMGFTEHPDDFMIAYVLL